MRTIKILVAACFLMLLTTSFSLNKDSKDHVNVWYKVSNDELNPGALIELDMSRGFSVADKNFIYIVVLDKDSVEYTIAFPNGGLWTAPTGDDFLLELEEEFENLEEYLKSRESTPIQKK